MARSRNIKPGFFSNEILAECKPLTRLLFAGLWTIADREGRLEDRPRKIKAGILPYDNCNVDDLLEELASKTDYDGCPAFIIRYKLGNAGYIQILNFAQHQNPHIKEAESIIPAPCLHNTSAIQEPDKNRSSHADSLLPITDSLLPISKKKPFGDIVKMTDAEYSKLCEKYGKEETDSKIEDMNNWLVQGKNRNKITDHYRGLTNWLKKDIEKKKQEVAKVVSIRPDIVF